MDLRDLVHGTADQVSQSMAIAMIPSQVPEQPAQPRWVDNIKWVVIESDLLDGEEVVLVLDKKHMKEAQQEEPDKVIYFLPEVDELLRHKNGADFKDMVKGVHSVKRKFKGWVVPANGNAVPGDKHIQINAK